MTNINFDGYRILKLNFENEKILRDGNYEVFSTYNTKVDYDEENNKCTCIYTLLMKTDCSDIDFNVEIKIIGFFTYAQGSDKKEVHIDVAKKLYPYLQSSVTSLMNTVGLPNFILPDFQLTVNDVN